MIVGFIGNRRQGMSYCYNKYVVENMGQWMAERDNVLKMNALNLARHHKKTCEGEECNISLLLLLEVLLQAGILVTDDEKREFL